MLLKKCINANDVIAFRLKLKNKMWWSFIIFSFVCISNTIGTNDLLGFARTGSKNMNDFTEGIVACDLKSLSLHVIMHVLSDAAFIFLLKVRFTHGFLAGKSGIFNEDEGKLALSFTKNNFHFPSSLFCFSTFLLFLSFITTTSTSTTIYYCQEMIGKRCSYQLFFLTPMHPL